MKTALETIGLSMLFVSVYLLSFLMMATLPRALAHETGQAHEHSQNEATPATTQSSDYTYVAQVHDSYTLLARKAIQTYGITENVKLSPAKIIFAETNLTIEAGSPRLNQGAKTTIKKDTVKKWIEAAQKITSAKEALWNAYVPYVNFNTDKVGQ